MLCELSGFAHDHAVPRFIFRFFGKSIGRQHFSDNAADIGERGFAFGGRQVLDAISQL
jgi:hypothetical protein